MSTTTPDRTIGTVPTTTVPTATAPAATPTATVHGFFDAYRDHDVEAMVSLCTDMAELRYVPVEIWGRQRVVRGDGKVRTLGKVFWTGLIDAFPDLTNEVTSVEADGNGNVAAEVVIGGTQAKDWGSVGNQGLRYDLPHLFLFHVEADGAIDRIVAYWDTAEMHRQLGRMEVD